MSCETIIYEAEYVNDDYDVMLNYKDCVTGYDFLDYLMGVNIGFNSIKYGELLKAYKGISKKIEFDIDKEKDYVIYVSY